MSNLNWKGSSLRGRKSPLSSRPCCLFKKSLHACTNSFEVRISSGRVPSRSRSVRVLMHGSSVRDLFQFLLHGSSVEFCSVPTWLSAPHAPISDRDLYMFSCTVSACLVCVLRSRFWLLGLSESPEWDESASLIKKANPQS